MTESAVMLVPHICRGVRPAIAGELARFCGELNLLFSIPFEVQVFITAAGTVPLGPDDSWSGLFRYFPQSQCAQIFVTTAGQTIAQCRHILAHEALHAWQYAGGVDPEENEDGIDELAGRLCDIILALREDRGHGDQETGQDHGEHCGHR